ARPLRDGGARSADHHGLRNHGWPVGRRRDGLLPIRPGDDRLVRRSLLRAFAAERRRLERRTGLISLLRWYWWRINAWGEIAAMVLSFLIAAYLHFGHVPRLCATSSDARAGRRSNSDNLGLACRDASYAAGRPRRASVLLR